MAERVMKKVLGDRTGGLTFVRPSELAKEGTTGLVAKGIYKGTLPNKYDEEKSDYKIEDIDNTYVLNSAGSLNKQMKLVEPGQYIEVMYNGKVEITSGKLEGKSVHDFQILAEEE